jgi:hypothetical protein
MSENLVRNILTTVVYYDVLDYPLTAFEVWKYLITKDYKSCSYDPDREYGAEKCALSEVIELLRGDELKAKIQTLNGFYFLNGRAALVNQRLRRNKIAEEKYKIVRRVVRFLRFVPYVRMIGVTGRMAMKNTEKKSDLDFFICLEAGHIFTGRTLVTMMVQLLGKRRYQDKIANRVCLNYFITTKSLEIETKTLFASSEYHFMLPVFGFKYFQKFQGANKWIEEYHGNYAPTELANAKMVYDSPTSRFIRRSGEKIFSSAALEQQLRTWQTRRIMDDSRTKKAGSLIVADEHSLVFLPDPQGPKIFEQFSERLEKLEC